MTPPILRAAIHLAQLGLAVHWLCSPSWGGKSPVRRAWQSVPCQAPDLLHRTYKSWFNVGLRTGAVVGARFCFVVLDLDSAGTLSWARRHLPMPALRVLTRRGEHWFFLRPQGGARIPNRAKIGQVEKDVRADEGQVVCPPSRHPSGHIYSWVEPPTPSLLSTLPVWDPGWFPQPQITIAQPACKLTAPAARCVARAIARAKHWPTAEESHGRGTQTFLLAAILVRELGLDAASAYNILAQHYNPRLPQPYDEPLLRRKVAEALKVRGSVPMQAGMPDPHHEIF